jgi:hypothetical protein
MNITESFQINVLEATPEDGRWVLIDASSSEVLINVIGRAAPLGLVQLRTLRAVLDHFIDAAEATEATTQAAIAAEFAE